MDPRDQGWPDHPEPYFEDEAVPEPRCHACLERLPEGAAVVVDGDELCGDCAVEARS